MKSKENTSRKRIKVNKTNMEKRGPLKRKQKHMADWGGKAEPFQRTHIGKDSWSKCFQLEPEKGNTTSNGA